MMTITDIARVAHEVNRAYCAFLGDDSQVPWEQAPTWQKESAINGVSAVIAKDLNAEQSHVNWMQEKVDAGWVYGAEKDPVAKTHPCLVPYRELPRDQRLKDTLFGAVVRALVGQ